MGTSTLATLRQKLSESIGDYQAETTTNAGSATTLVCSALVDKPDDYYNDWWVIPTSGTYSGVAKKIYDFTGSSGTITVYQTWAGTPGSGITFELHRFLPSDYTRALNEAAKECYPYLHKRIFDENVISGNWLLNGGFEDWAASTIPDYWAALAGGDSIAANTAVANRKYGAKSAYITAAATGGINQTTTQSKRLFDLAGKSVTFKAWVKTALTDVRLYIYDGTTKTYSGYHTGGNTFELLEVTATIRAEPSQVAFAIISTAGGILYADQARVYGHAKYDYLLPTPIIDLQQVLLQGGGYADQACDDIKQNEPFEPIFDWRVEYDGTDRVLYINTLLNANYKFRLIGTGYLSTLSADTDTIEIDGADIRPLLAYAAFLLYEQNKSVVAAEDRENYISESKYWYGRYDVLKKQFCLAKPVAIPFPQ